MEDSHVEHCEESCGVGERAEVEDSRLDHDEGDRGRAGGRDGLLLGVQRPCTCYRQGGGGVDGVHDKGPAHVS